MKVVINRCWGGFDLSDLAKEMMIELGFTVNDKDDGVWEDLWKDPEDGHLHILVSDEKEFRADPRLVQIVEDLGKDAWGSSSKLKIVEIPFDTTEGWYIYNNDGMEAIHEPCRCKCGSWS